MQSVNKNIIICLFWVASLLFGSANFSPGLLFTGNNPNQRTSLQLPAEEHIELPSRFTLDIELSIWDKDLFCYVFELENESGDQILVSYVDYLKPDTSYFTLSLNGRKEKSIPVEKSILHRGNWFLIRLSINNEKNIHHFAIGDNNPVEIKKSLSKNNHWQFNAGHRQERPDVGYLAMRNIKIFDSEQNPIALWKLDEFEGEIVHESIQNEKGKMTAGEWLYTYHTDWQVKKEWTLPAKLWRWYDHDTHELFINGHGWYRSYNLKTEEESTGELPEFPDGFDKVQVVRSKDGRFFAYKRGRSPLSFLLEDGTEWSPIDTSQLSDEFFNTPLYRHPTTGDFYIIGGYGNYSVKNLFQRYNFESESWNTLKIKISDEIPFYPRFIDAIAPGDDDNILYVSGGRGNESGKQEEGWQDYFDIWKLDLSDQSLELIAGFDKNNFYGFRIKGLSFYKSTGDFFIIVEEDIEELPKRMKSYSWSENTQTLKFISEWKTSAQVNKLFFDRQLSELILFGEMEEGDSIKATLLRLRLPILKSPPKKAHAGFVQIFIPVILLIVIGVWLVARRSDQTLNQNMKENLPQTNLPIMNRTNHIYVFGEFTVWDKTGEDISHLFSPKIRELFLLIFLYSFSGNGRSRGITTERLTGIMWPDSTPESAKNSRGTAINKLRKILFNLNGITVLVENHHWIINIDSELKCDYLDYLNYKDDDQHIADYLKTVSRGQLLELESFSWLDPIQADTLQNVTTKVESYSKEVDQPNTANLMGIVKNHWPIKDQISV